MLKLDELKAQVYNKSKELNEIKAKIESSPDAIKFGQVNKELADLNKEIEEFELKKDEVK